MDFPPQIETEILNRFSKHHTVNQIASELGLEPDEVLRFLTKRGKWSEFCGECKIKRCFDCKDLAELGQPIQIQDQVNFLASRESANDKT